LVRVADLRSNTATSCRFTDHLPKPMREICLAVSYFVSDTDPRGAMPPCPPSNDCFDWKPKSRGYLFGCQPRTCVGFKRSCHGHLKKECAWLSFSLRLSGVALSLEQLHGAIPLEIQVHGGILSQTPLGFATQSEALKRQVPHDDHREHARPHWDSHSFDDKRRSKNDAHQMANGDQQEHYSGNQRKGSVAHGLLHLRQYCTPFGGCPLLGSVLM
jgi:hypothetical protein